MLSILLFIFAVGAAVASVDTTCGLNVLGSLEGTKVSKSKYALVYIVSCTLGGAMTGLAIGCINFGLKLTPVGLYQNYIIVVLFAILLGLELIHKTGILPSGNFIVPSEWIKHAGYRSAALWGQILGLSSHCRWASSFTLISWSPYSRLHGGLACWQGNIWSRSRHRVQSPADPIHRIPYA